MRTSRCAPVERMLADRIEKRLRNSPGRYILRRARRNVYGEEARRTRRCDTCAPQPIKAADMGHPQASDSDSPSQANLHPNRNRPRNRNLQASSSRLQGQDYARYTQHPYRRHSCPRIQGGEPQANRPGRSVRPLQSIPSSAQPHRLLRQFRRPFHGETSRRTSCTSACHVLAGQSRWCPCVRARCAGKSVVLHHVTQRGAHTRAREVPSWSHCNHAIAWWCPCARERGVPICGTQCPTHQGGAHARERGGRFVISGDSPWMRAKEDDIWAHQPGRVLEYSKKRLFDSSFPINSYRMPD